jgi:radical SAM superfamily enzyme YgiQ (UPF0313 family)
MRIHLVNPSDVSFGTAVITPRWQYVLAAATPARHGTPILVDETLEPMDERSVEAGDVVGIGIHTGNALRGYRIGTAARARGAFVVFGGIHATLFPDEAREHGGAHAVVTGDGDLVWPAVLDDCDQGEPQPLYAGGRVDGDAFYPARWDLLPKGRYMWASVQTVRGCPKHCSFCSVWRTDGQKPRQRDVNLVVREIVQLRRQGFRFVVLADDNFYPVTLADLAAAERRADTRQHAALTRIREERFELMARLEQLPDDMVFYTQITMEAAEDPAFLAAMRRARIRGALVGVESVTAEGLKAVFKDFNEAGEGLVTRLQAFREADVHVLGSFIFGLPTDTPETFAATADLAQRAGISFAQFVMLQPLPGTVDFARWERDATDVTMTDGVPLSRYWLIPAERRPRVYTPHPMMSPDELRSRTQGVWDRFYALPLVWQRSRFLMSVRARLAFVLISKLYRLMYANTGIATDSARVQRSAMLARRLAPFVRRLFVAGPMPSLREPRRAPRLTGKRIPVATALMALALAAAPVAGTSDPARTFLTAAFNLSAAEIGRLDRGEVISRTLDVKNRREVATLGIVRIKTSPSKYVARLTDITTFKRTADVLQIGTFGSVPQPSDVASLTVDEPDLKRLRECRPGDCEVRLSAEGIERVRREIDWRAPDASRKANALLRQLLVDYVTRYRQSGMGAAMEYANREPRLNVGREFASLIEADAITSQYAPRLRRHLLDFPAASAEKITDFVYWSKELVRGRPVVSITHVATAAAVDDGPVASAIGSKQIYAMHYFDASLGLTLLVPDRTSTSPATYVVYLNRSRIDLFDGLFGGVARRIVAGRARGLVAEQLQRLQRNLAGDALQEARSPGR